MKYKLVNNNDGNIEIPLESTEVDKAYGEALDVLEWGLVEVPEED